MIELTDVSNLFEFEIESQISVLALERILGFDLSDARVASEFL